MLSSDLLMLRPLLPKDFDALFQVASDPLIWEQHPASDRYKEEVFSALFRESLDSGGALIAIDREKDVVIGSSRFHGYDLQKSEVEIGWSFLARSYWGGLYNREMKRLMLDHAFRFVDNVVLLIGSHNYRSQKAAEKVGGVYVGKRSAEGRDESLVYRITKRLET
jgi:RimJ/RimL family protein N-acetyltransferase